MYFQELTGVASDGTVTANGAIVGPITTNRVKGAAVADAGSCGGRHCHLW